MLCCLCKEREAKVHVTQVFGGPSKKAKVMERVDLCEDCARKRGVNDPSGFSLADLLMEVKKARGD